MIYRRTPARSIFCFASLLQGEEIHVCVFEDTLWAEISELLKILLQAKDIVEISCFKI